MNKSSALLLICALTAAAAVPAAAGQSVQDVLDRMIEAQGGRKALAAIKDSTMVGTMEMTQMGFNGAITMYHKEPNKIRMDIELMGMIITQAFDGETAWMINPQTGAAEEIPESIAKDLKRQAYGNDALLNPEKFGIAYSLGPRETIGGTEYIALKQTMEDGFESTFFLDPSTHLPAVIRARGTNQAGVEVPTETHLSDYRKENGLAAAHKIVNYQDGAEFMTMTVSKVTYNSGLQDSLFEMGSGGPVSWNRTAAPL